MDGCFIKLTNGAQVLVATARDGNNNLFPLAFGVVGKEDADNLIWFLNQLKYALDDNGDCARLTIMSERQMVWTNLSLNTPTICLHIYLMSLKLAGAATCHQISFP